MQDYTEIFCYVDDFCKAFEDWWIKKQISTGSKKRKRLTKLSLSEITTLMVSYHQYGHKCFKSYYSHVMFYHHRDFPNLVSYDRFTALMKRAFPVVLMLFGCLRSKPTKILFADSTPYRVCKNARIKQHKVFQGLAARSKNSLGWFYGLRLHLVFNAQGGIVRLSITPANVDDRKGLLGIAQGLTGKIFADRGYISQALFDTLLNQGLQLITRIRKNMKNKLMSLLDKTILAKRMTVESIFSSIKSCGIFEHSRHRSIINAFSHILAALIAYQLNPNKPAFFPITLTSIPYP